MWGLCHTHGVTADEELGLPGDRGKQVVALLLAQLLRHALFPGLEGLRPLRAHRLPVPEARLCPLSSLVHVDVRRTCWAHLAPSPQ